MFASVDAEIVTDLNDEPPDLFVYGTLTRRGAGPLDGTPPAVGFRQTTSPQAAAGRCWLYDAARTSVDVLSAGAGRWRFTLSASLAGDDQWCEADLCPICELSLVVDDGQGRPIELPGPFPVRPARTLAAGEPCDPTRGHERDACDRSLLCMEPMGESGHRCVDPVTVCRPIWPYADNASP